MNKSTFYSINFVKHDEVDKLRNDEALLFFANVTSFFRSCEDCIAALNNITARFS